MRKKLNMKLYIIRHGETTWNKEKRLQGQSDIELNEYGVELAKITSEALKNIDFRYIFSSPLKRAYHTAEILRRNRDVYIVTDDRIKEACFGINEGLPPNEVTADFHLFFDAPDKYIPAKGGETYEQICSRSQDFIENVLIPLSLKDPDCNVLITSHGALIKSMLIYFKHLQIKNIWDGEFPKNCCAYVVDINGHQFNVLEEAKIYY